MIPKLDRSIFISMERIRHVALSGWLVTGALEAVSLLFKMYLLKIL